MSGIIMIPLVTLAMISLTIMTPPVMSQQTNLLQACPVAPLTTNNVCGRPGLTLAQIRQIKARNETVEAIARIARPIYDGSPEAEALGISADNPIVNLTIEQTMFFERCGGQSDGGSDEGITRKRRQADDTPAPCCNPSPTRVKVLASVSENGRPVEVIQPPNAPQMFHDGRNCPASLNCPGVLCGAIVTTLPVEVIFLDGDPLRSGRANILIDICGARES